MYKLYFYWVPCDLSTKYSSCGQGYEQNCTLYKLYFFWVPYDLCSKGSLFVIVSFSRFCPDLAWPLLPNLNLKLLTGSESAIIDRIRICKCGPDPNLQMLTGSESAIVDRIRICNRWPLSRYRIYITLGIFDDTIILKIVLTLLCKLLRRQFIVGSRPGIFKVGSGFGKNGRDSLCWNITEVINFVSLSKAKAVLFIRPRSLGTNYKK